MVASGFYTAVFTDAQPRNNGQGRKTMIYLHNTLDSAGDPLP
jgi:hypothetical protein